MTETWQCPECLDHFGEEDDDVPPVCIMCRKGRPGVIVALFEGALAAVVEREAPYDVEAGLARLMDSLNGGDGATHCTRCLLTIEWSPEKGGMADISGATYCVDMEPHRPDRPPEPPLPAPPLRRNPSSRRIPPR